MGKIYKYIEIINVSWNKGIDYYQIMCENVCHFSHDKKNLKYPHVIATLKLILLGFEPPTFRLQCHSSNHHTCN